MIQNVVSLAPALSDRCMHLINIIVWDGIIGLSFNKFSLHVTFMCGKSSGVGARWGDVLERELLFFFFF